MLAGLKRWRPRTLRFAEEEAWVARWLDLVERTLAVDPAAAREVVATAAWCAAMPTPTSAASPTGRPIMERVVEPMLAGDLPRVHFADAVLQARLAASQGPRGLQRWPRPSPPSPAPRPPPARSPRSSPVGRNSPQGAYCADHKIAAQYAFGYCALQHDPTQAPFHTRIAAAPVLHDRERAERVLAEIERRCGEQADLAALGRLIAEPSVRDLLMGTFGASPYLGSLAERHPASLLATLTVSPGAALRGAAAHARHRHGLGRHHD